MQSFDFLACFGENVPTKLPMDKDEKEEKRITYKVMHKGQMKSTNVCTISVPDGRTIKLD